MKILLTKAIMTTASTTTWTAMGRRQLISSLVIWLWPCRACRSQSEFNLFSRSPNTYLHGLRNSKILISNYLKRGWTPKRMFRSNRVSSPYSIRPNKSFQMFFMTISRCRYSVILYLTFWILALISLSKIHPAWFKNSKKIRASLLSTNLKRKFLHLTARLSLISSN